MVTILSALTASIVGSSSLKTASRAPGSVRTMYRIRRWSYGGPGINIADPAMLERGQALCI
jgi:hypothetical protein